MTSAKCPECKEYIDYLDCRSYCWQKAHLDAGDYMHYEAAENIEAGGTFFCPKCGKQVCELEATAIRILQGAE